MLIDFRAKLEVHILPILKLTTPLMLIEAKHLGKLLAVLAIELEDLKVVNWWYYDATLYL